MAKIVSFSLDNESLELLDKIEKITSFKNRSELIRAALQILLNESKNLEELEGHISAILVVTHVERTEYELSRIQHQFNDVISTQIHNNMHGMCMETFILHGNAQTIRSFVRTLKESKAVSYVKLMVVDE